VSGQEGDRRGGAGERRQDLPQGRGEGPEVSAGMIPVEITQTPWHFTTWPDALDRWQTGV
jgi:hypothetical protein